MGSAFSCLPRYGWCVPKQRNDANDVKNHSHTPRKLKGHRRNISAAFNMAEMDNEYNVEKVNINTASEEELMTLPGINRHIAHNIIEYRQQIGGYKRIEDLALVSGVGATKLAILKLEISVNGKKSSLNSSLSSSHQDISFQDNASRTSSKSQSSNMSKVLRINLNTSNVFQLMRVRGITQTLAENIVIYRDKRGAFTSLDDLIRVKGINSGLLSAIRPQLTLNETTNNNTSLNTSHTHSSRRKTSTAQNSFYLNNHVGGSECANSLRKLDSQEDLCSVYGPLGRRSVRPTSKSSSSVGAVLRGGGGGDGDVIRVASWNLQQCTADKANNPGVKEVFAMTLLENEISIIAVQELQDREALQKLCDELNSPTVPNVKRWLGQQQQQRGTWKCVTSPASCGTMLQGEEYLGFLWNTSHGIELKSHDLLSNVSPTAPPFPRQPYLAIFQLSQYDLFAVNVHLKCSDVIASRLSGAHDDLTALVQTVHKHSHVDSAVMLLGDFNLSPDVDRFSQLGELGYSNVFHQDQYTNTSVNNPEGTKCCDNVWMGEQLQSLQTGIQEVIRDGLSSPWIPNGWGWGGLISDHCPIMTELKTKCLPLRRPEDVSFAVKVTTG